MDRARLHDLAGRSREQPELDVEVLGDRPDDESTPAQRLAPGGAGQAAQERVLVALGAFALAMARSRFLVM